MFLLETAHSEYVFFTCWGLELSVYDFPYYFSNVCIPCIWSLSLISQWPIKISLSVFHKWKKRACSKFSDTCCWEKPNQGSGLHQAVRASPCQPKHSISNFFRTRPPLHVLASAICSGTLVTHLHIWGMGYCSWFAASVYLGKISTCF